MKPITLIYMVAGMSSRFGGKMKFLTEVGPNGETLLEHSLNQALSFPFSKIIFIVSKNTEQAIKEKFGNSYRRIPISYAIQSMDENERDKPWGTTDALCSAHNLINEPFIVCNGDDLYGAPPFRKLFDHFQISPDSATVGYSLAKVLPREGTTTRGIIEEKDGFVAEIKETFDISAQNFREKGLKENTPCNMNLFALQPEVLSFLKKIMERFKKNHQGDRKAECLLPVELSNLIKEGKIRMKIYPTEEAWMGITNPGDEVIIREKLKEPPQMLH